MLASWTHFVYDKPTSIKSVHLPWLMGNDLRPSNSYKWLSTSTKHTKCKLTSSSRLGGYKRDISECHLLGMICLPWFVLLVHLFHEHWQVVHILPTIQLFLQVSFHQPCWSNPGTNRDLYIHMTCLSISWCVLCVKDIPSNSLLFASEWIRAIIPQALEMVCLKNMTWGLISCSRLVTRASSSCLNSSDFSVMGYRKMTAAKGRGTKSNSSGSKPWNGTMSMKRQLMHEPVCLTINVSIRPIWIHAMLMSNLRMICVNLCFK